MKIYHLLLEKKSIFQHINDENENDPEEAAMLEMLIMHVCISSVIRLVDVL